MSERNHLQLSNEERRIVNLYTSQYNQISIRINQTHNTLNRLYDSLDEIRDNINNIIQPHLLRNNGLITSVEPSVLPDGPSVSSSGPSVSSSGPSVSSSGPSVSSSGPSVLHSRSSNRLRQPQIFYDYTSPINRSLYQIPAEQPNTNANANANTNANNSFNNLIYNFLSTPVPVRPTATQIANASRVIRYSSIENPIASACAISLEPFAENDMVRQINHCKHLFFPDQFDEWFSNNVKCPVCRYDIRNINSETNATAETNSTSEINSTAETNTNNRRDILSSFTDALFEELFNVDPNNNSTNNSSNNSSNIRYDSANDVLLYEAIIRPSTNDSSRST
jgi:hypothetical protein